jgi:hypothetical protein
VPKHQQLSPVMGVSQEQVKCAGGDRPNFALNMDGIVRHLLLPIKILPILIHSISAARDIHNTRHAFTWGSKSSL